MIDETHPGDPQHGRAVGIHDCAGFRSAVGRLALPIR
jgi:hypothetical protein